MPAEDRYHQTVVRILKGTGWRVLKNQYRLTVLDRLVWVDMLAQDTEGTMALFEVKGFENMRSPVDYLAATIGQYVLYQGILDDTDAILPLYLAVPKAAYEGILAEPIGQIAIQKAKLKLMVFDPYQMEVITWTH